MRRIIIILGLTGLAWSAAPAAAQDGNRIAYQGWGPRIGLTTDPEQFHFGAHLDITGPSNHLRFTPNLEVGLGDDMTLLAINGEAHYRFFADWDRWSPYAGGGLGLNLLSDDDEGLRDDTDSELGLSALGGIERYLANGNRFFIEGKAGLVDSPDLKLSVGWTFF